MLATSFAPCVALGMETLLIRRFSMCSIDCFLLDTASKRVGSTKTWSSTQHCLRSKSRWEAALWFTNDLRTGSAKRGRVSRERAAMNPFLLRCRYPVNRTAHFRSLFRYCTEQYARDRISCFLVGKTVLFLCSADELSVAAHQSTKQYARRTIPHTHFPLACYS